MRQLIALAVVLAVAAISASAQSDKLQLQGQSPKEVVEQFCKMDAEGKWLDPSSLRVRVVQNYVLRPARIDGKTAVVGLDYFVWGELEGPSLRFVRLEGLISGLPVEYSGEFHLDLVSPDKDSNNRHDGRQEEKKAGLRWKIGTYAGCAGISVETAIHFVAEMRNKTNDPTIKKNADATLAALKSILAGRPEPLQRTTALVESPAQVMRRFAALETIGTGLTPEGWRELARFFVKSPKPQWDTIRVVGEFEFYYSRIEGDKAELTAEFVPAGELDSSLRLLDEDYAKYIAPLSHACCTERLYYTLIFSEKHWEAASEGAAAKEITGPLAWRIEESPPEPWISVDTAILYVTEMRDRTTDPIIKKNADRTLTILKDTEQSLEMFKHLPY